MVRAKIPSLAVSLLCTAFVACANAKTQYAPDNWKPEYSELEISFSNGGCETPSDAKSCQVATQNLYHTDGFFDTTELNKANTYFVKGKIVIVEPVDVTSSGCPLLRFDQQGDIVFVSYDADPYIGWGENNCTIAKLAKKVADTGAKALMLASPECVFPFQESELSEDMIKYCERLKRYQFYGPKPISKFVSSNDNPAPTIPTVILTHYDGLRLRECLKGKSILTPTKCRSGSSMSASFEWNMMKKDTYSFEIFDHVYHAKKPVYFDSRFFDAVLPTLINDRPDFKHSMTLYESPHCENEQHLCSENCFENLCPVIPLQAKEDGVNGRQILEEGMRRHALYLDSKFSTTKLQSYWEYLRSFYLECQLKGEFNNDCSKTVMESLGYQFSKANVYAEDLEDMESLLNNINDRNKAANKDSDDAFIFNEKKIYIEGGLPEEAFVRLLQPMCHASRASADKPFHAQCECLGQVSDREAYVLCVRDKLKENRPPFTPPGDGNKEPNELPAAKPYSVWLPVSLVLLSVFFLISIMYYRERRLKRELNAELSEILVQHIPNAERSGPDTRRIVTEHLQPISTSPEQVVSREIQMA